MTLKYAIVRDVPDTYDKCVRVTKPVEKIDVKLAQKQHGAYCNALKGLGLKVIRIPADNRFPDCCFVEDPAIVIGDTAIISRMGAKSRRGEEHVVRRALARYKKIRWIKPPGTIEGGDVLQVSKNIYIGLSGRTNRLSLQQINAFVRNRGYKVIPVRIKNIVHLKTGCTYLANNCIVLVKGCFDETIFSGYKGIVIPKEESYSANCIAVGPSVLIPKGCPDSRRLIKNTGFKVVELEMSEFRKGGGSLTCLSILF